MLDQLIKQLPKAELHIHIEGSLEPELMFEMAKRNRINLPFNTVDEIRSAYNFKDLQSFLDIYYAGAKVLIDTQDFFELTWSYLVKVNKENVKHVEIFFDPQTHTDRGIHIKTVITGIHMALDKAQKQFGITSYLILCFLRHLSEESALETLNDALPYRNWIKGVGLDSSELGHPPKKFERVFAKATKEGFKKVAHAGEEGPPEYIWQALEILGVSRIDHGIRCSEDIHLVKYLSKEKIPLTICPLSNIKLKVFQKMGSHNIKDLFNSGICVTINSDDPAYFGGYLNENYLAVQKGLGLSKKEIVEIAKNGFRASFLSKESIEKNLKDFDNF